jgi:hypothetical protein
MRSGARCSAVCVTADHRFILLMTLLCCRESKTKTMTPQGSNNLIMPRWRRIPPIEHAERVTESDTPDAATTAAGKGTQHYYQHTNGHQP